MKPMKQIPILRQALATDISGSVLPMAAASVLVMAALVGGGFDMSRAYRVQNRLQNACDSGVLAGRRAVSTNGFDTAAQTQANKYFNVNFDPAIQGTNNTSASFVADTRANSISGTASTRMPMLLMQIFGKTTMNIQARCTSTMGVGNSDVMMVLDVTGSMSSSLGSGTRMSALQSAMKNFYTTLANSTSGTNARVRYGFVPFSSTVNVGSLLYTKDPSYLADSMTIQSREAKFDTVVTQVFVNWTTPVNTSSTQYSAVTNSSSTSYTSTSYNSQSACTTALPANTAWANNGSSSQSSGTTTTGTPPNTQQVVTTTTTQPQRMTNYLCQKSGNKYYRYQYYSYRDYLTYAYATSNGVYNPVTSYVFNHFDYKPVTYNTSQFKAFQPVSTKTGSNGTAVSSTWGGCIEERDTVNSSTYSYSTLGGMSPSDALDLDLDLEPDSDPETKWAPLWPQVSYSRNTLAVATSGASNSSTVYCPKAAKGLQTMSQSTFNTYADSLVPTGGTYLDIGMIWGGRLISQEGIFADTVNDAPANGGNVSRHVIFMTDGDMDTSNGVYQAYGMEWLDRRVTSDGSKAQEDARHSLRFRAVCDAIKAKGVRVWVIAFTNGLNADLTYCTSPSSSFTANTSAQLNTAFQEIAKQVGELRVLQ
jgi:Flp pilus assembly protein TadG